MSWSTGKKVAAGVLAVGTVVGVAYVASQVSGTTPPGSGVPPTLEVNGGIGPITVTEKVSFMLDATGLTPGKTIDIVHGSSPSISTAVKSGSRVASKAGTADYTQVIKAAKATRYFAVQDPVNGISNWVEVTAS